MMSEQPIVLALVEKQIEHMSKTLFHCVTLNSNTH